ncbi:MAG: hypothetical protein A3C85_02385 [Candidatus Doudnabacteria bacterium RIFCSPHIGHO2_02_FULL_48_21]|uniref:Uncharacterized protein n=1 Tax=Candidatus Doudnabacteria bacterium RIFCSPLOWO2_02_FULL_48_13 TaxID=1817845 RepID=A0A1F5QCI8_9BACT|nr:MAG: hypothetical protein A3K05_01440 [Candidatus Doudnabacteria bacterium RIFCSPHIGHO2_01_48_18]OGE79807.1 MAG: hypothetical protein A2668_02265 [Candidatus Doudnabacteria bacterium RIFCSPHIGHO2_01_FULL_48_180]OGE91518.1 MAG: hypothetical protein A3F44_02370 [Candidatus Doudnabacteria bacterium RIFCSPHIGHO2_12_FULL_47_25]OGE93986.1 MAG: hypothetical protein A3C85_02385 [Candidatus Doudnabacteria bacterium RIFCSPHIGHO2_02_FULL_48_21]OGE98040.1 MAG: hypothetical protein A3A83_02690 [Candidatu
MTTPAKFFFVGVLVVGLDQITKLYAAENFPIIKNPGMILGINLPGFFDAMLIALLLVLFAVLYIYYFRRPSLDFVLILAGAVSNLLDRFILGYVRDFIDAGIAMMNIADIAVWLGIIFLLVTNFRKAA